MKKLIPIFLVVLLILPVYAHSGRTDKNGGHYDHSTGEYHYHHGYPAHQHTNGVCPYDFDDKTGQSSGTSGGGSTPTSGKGSEDLVHTGTTADDPPGFSIPIPAVVIGCAIGGFTLLYLFFVISGEKQAREYMRQWESRRNELLDLYGGKTKLELAFECGMPDGIEIGPDGLPKEINSTGWGDSLTFYVSPSGEAYHRCLTCTKSAVIPIHAANLQNRRPCYRCFPCAPDMDWYWEYRRILELLEDYQINTVDEVELPSAIVCLKTSEMRELTSKEDSQ